MKYKVLTWDEFREACKEDAHNWFNSGSEYQETDDLSSCFTPQEFATTTIDYIRELQEV